MTEPLNHLLVPSLTPQYTGAHGNLAARSGQGLVELSEIGRRQIDHIDVMSLQLVGQFIATPLRHVTQQQPGATAKCHEDLFGRCVKTR
ncbi:hypothetical protein D3C81_1992180 [compost metagenome]